MPKGIYKRTPEMMTGKYKHYPHQGGFKKGQPSAFKGRKHSKKSNEKNRKAHIGKIPWNKNKKLHYPVWNKDKKCPQWAGKNSPSWKGGKYISDKGYVFIFKSEHPFCNKKGYVKQANLVMEKHLSRYLTKDEIVHHKGIKYPISSIKNKQDDRLENLQLFKNQSEHMKFHCSLKNNC